MHKFCKKKNCKFFANNLSKEICTFLVFLNYTSGYLNFANIFAYLKWHGQGLFKNRHFIIFWTFFSQTFSLYNWIFKSINFCKFANFFADSKSRAQELSNDVSFVIFGHQTYPGFQVPQQG